MDENESSIYNYVITHSQETNLVTCMDIVKDEKYFTPFFLRMNIEEYWVCYMREPIVT